MINNSLTQRNKEGYLMIDNRNNEGMPDALVVSVGLPLIAAKGLFEAPTYTCSHCNAVVVLNPNRQRERAHCRGCDHLICDNCNVIRLQTMKCKTFKQIVDETILAAERQADNAILLPN